MTVEKKKKVVELAVFVVVPVRCCCRVYPL